MAIRSEKRNVTSNHDLFTFNESDAALIAEVGTVYHETGKTPARLVEENRELLEALEGLMMTSDLNEDFLSPHTWDALEKAQKAIAKAKGVNSEEA